MKYANNFLHLLMLSHIIYFSNSTPLFGSEKVHIKVHVPEGISHNFHEAAKIREPKISINHQNHHEQGQQAPVIVHIRTKLRHNQRDSLLENFLFSDWKNTFDDASIEELTEHLFHTTDEAAYRNAYIKIAPKRPTKYINTFKVVEYKAAGFGKNYYVNQPNHQTRAPYTETGYKSAYTQENNHEFTTTIPIMELIPNTNAYLPPYEYPTPSIDIPNLTTNVLLPPKETLTPPIKEAEDFHSEFNPSAAPNEDLLPFIGDMYLPVGEKNSLAPEAIETYNGFDSYSASHVQGIDDQSYSPYRRKGKLI